MTRGCFIQVGAMTKPVNRQHHLGACPGPLVPVKYRAAHYRRDESAEKVFSLIDFPVS